VFNLNYNIEIETNYKTKYISDYVYWDSQDTQTMANNLHYLSEIKYFNDNFINQVNGNGFINKNEISSIKFIPRKNRVIFNLSHPVTFKDFDGKDKITSEFVYVNCNNETQYAEYKNYVSEKLGEN
jgi:DNA integrity scanning protein DisA with diadenylate cyclase activity